MNSGSELSGGAACPACATPGPHPLHLSLMHDGKELALHRCTACGARFYVPVPVMDYATHTDDVNSLRHYVEYDANIGNMLEVLGPALVRKPGGAMLDIGCGFGFGADLARHGFGWQARGVEPSAYGRAGSVELGLPILNRFLDFDDPFDGLRFDVVYCSEVIEHAEDPAALVALMRHYLAADGCLVITTPAADAVDDAAVSQSQKLALLSPGSHVLLFTELALDRLLRAAGFPHVFIRRHGVTLVAYATRDLAQFPPLDNVAERLLDHYRRRVADLPDSMARRGFAARLFIERVGRGQYPEALTLWRDAGFILPKSMPAVADFSDYMAQLPTSASPLAYCRGMLALNHESDPVLAAQLFQFAADAAVAKMRVVPGGAIVEQGTYWNARFHHALALRYCGDQAGAALAARSILAQEPAAVLPDFGPPDAALLARARELAAFVPGQ